jgi:PAS domain S-box-containing protein
MSGSAHVPDGLDDPAGQFELLFHDSPYGLVYHDASGRIIAINAAAQAIFGLSEGAALGKDSFDPEWRTIHEDGSPFPPDNHPSMRCLREGIPVRGVVMGVWNPGESRHRWMRLDAVPRFSGASDKPIQVLVWVADITEHVLITKAEARSRDRFHSLFDNMSEGVALHELVLDGEGRAVNYRIVDINARYEAHVGISRETAVGRLGTEAYGVCPAPYLAEYAEVAASGRPYHFSTYFPPLDRHFLISVAPLGREGFATIFFDISDIKRAEAEKERLLVELERKNKELESIVYVASHDLRTPLVNIQGFGQRLDKDCAELAAKVETAAAGDAAAAASVLSIARERLPRSLDFIRSSASKMDKLISGLLKLSRTGRVELVRERIDMEALVRGIVSSTAFQIEREGVSIEIGDLPPCFGDGEQVAQVFSNLIDNAIKYRSADRPLRIGVRGESDGAEVRYVVEDTGMGIAGEHLAKVWELFYRLDPGSGPAGEGLGLSLVRRIVERHGGRAWAESEPGEGSRFFVALPAAPRRGA